MEYLGEYSNRKVYWWDYATRNYNEWPAGNWICFAMADKYPGVKEFSDFAVKAIEKRVLEFKAHGKCCEELHDDFDLIVVISEIDGNSSATDIMTTWHNHDGIASVFWQCFHATCLPDDTNNNNLKIVCVDFDNNDKRGLLVGYLQMFESDWVPSDND